MSDANFSNPRLFQKLQAWLDVPPTQLPTRSPFNPIRLAFFLETVEMLNKEMLKSQQGAAKPKSQQPAPSEEAREAFYVHVAESAGQEFAGTRTAASTTAPSTTGAPASSHGALWPPPYYQPRNSCLVRLLHSSEYPLLDVIATHAVYSLSKIQNVLLATADTTLEEVELFLLRAAFQENNHPSHLIHLELLSYEIQVAVLDILRLEFFFGTVPRSSDGEDGCSSEFSGCRAPLFFYVAPALAKSSVVAQDLVVRGLGLRAVSEVLKQDFKSYLEQFVLSGLSGAELELVTSERPGEGKTRYVRGRHDARASVLSGGSSDTTLLPLYVTDPEVDATQQLLDRIWKRREDETGGAISVWNWAPAGAEASARPGFLKGSSMEGEATLPPALHLVIGGGLSFSENLAQMIFRLVVLGEVVESSLGAWQRGSPSAAGAVAARGAASTSAPKQTANVLADSNLPIGWRRRFQIHENRREIVEIYIETSNLPVVAKTGLQFLPQTRLLSPSVSANDVPHEIFLQHHSGVLEDPAFRTVASKYAQLRTFQTQLRTGQVFPLPKFPRPRGSFVGAAQLQELDLRGERKDFDTAMDSRDFKDALGEAIEHRTEFAVLELCLQACGLENPTWAGLMLFVRFFAAALKEQEDKGGMLVAEPVGHLTLLEVVVGSFDSSGKTFHFVVVI